MRVALIHPPHKESIANPTAIKDREFGSYPPLGLLAVAAYLEQHTEHRTEIIDCQAPGVRSDYLEQELQRIRPELAGIYVTSWTLRDVIAAAAAVKRLSTEIQVVAGGPHLRLYPEEILELPGIDYGVLGEGEETFTELVQALDGGVSPAAIPGLVFRQGETIVRTLPRPVQMDLNRFPWPDYSKIRHLPYRSVFSRKTGFTTMETARGCPHRCVFCYNDGSPYRRREPEAVVEALAALCRQGFTEIYFVDDSFNLQPEHPLEIARGLIARQTKLEWSCRARAQHIDVAYCRELARAGCKRIQFGIESGSPLVLQQTGKDIQRAEVERAFAAARTAGITTLAYFLFGLPGESERDIKETIKFAAALKPDYALFGVTMLLPETPLYRQALQTGLLTRDVWREYVRQPFAEFVPPVFSQHVSTARLYRRRDWAHCRFYLRLGYAWSLLNRTRTLDGLLQLAHGARLTLRSASRCLARIQR